MPSMPGSALPRSPTSAGPGTRRGTTFIQLEAELLTVRGPHGGTGVGAHKTEDWAGTAAADCIR
jgi:hypothetical protein